MNIRKQIKQAAYWAALFVVATVLTTAVSLIGAEVAGKGLQTGWALAKLASLLAAILCLLGWVCEQIEQTED